MQLGAVQSDRLRYAGRLGVLTAAYFVLAKGGLEFAFANESVTAVWAPTGLALAAVVLWGYRMWPAIAVGAFLANITTAGPVLAVAGIATGNTLEALAGAFLLSRVPGFRPSLERIHDVAALVLAGAVASTTISATIGVASLWAAGLVADGELLSTWRVWWLGDACGDLIVAPAILVLASGDGAWLSRRPRTESLAVGGLLAAVSVAVFTAATAAVYLVFPVLFWVSYRFRQEGTVVAGLIVSGIALWFTARGYGPFATGSGDAELLQSQTFVGVATITGLLVAAVAAERQRFEDRLRHLADHDPLTGLANRRRFTEELERWAAYTSRHGGEGAVLVMDVDNLKSVNDRFGHAAGDELLASVAAVLDDRTRRSDVVGRLGGDEFVALLPRSGLDEAAAVANALLDEVGRRATFTSGEDEVHPTLSIGISLFGPDGELDPERILVEADAAMYAAKDAGRNRVHAAGDIASTLPTASS